MALDNVWVITVIVAFMFRLIQSCPGKCDCDKYSPYKMTCDSIILTTKDLKELKIPSYITELRLLENDIQEISSEILKNFENLTSFEISNNLISTIPTNTFKDFKLLKTLKLRDNKIHTITQKSFSGLQNLRKLDLGNNDISLLRTNVFHQLNSVEEIKLMYNKIKSLPNRVFPTLKNLRYLFLRNNNISFIGDHAFQNMSMNRIGLTHNKLQNIPYSAFSGVKISYKILLYFNPLECNCRGLMDYAVNLKHLRHKILGYCESPYEAKDKDIFTAYTETKCSFCDLKPCRNGGICTGNKTWYRCSCTEKFKGRRCDVSICEYKIRYVTKLVYVPGNTVIQYQKRDRDNETVPTVVIKQDGDTQKKLMILYAMCSLEFIVILCFVALFMWKRYQDWKLLKEYDHQKRKQILEKIRNTTNKKLQESLY